MDLGDIKAEFDKYVIATDGQEIRLLNPTGWNKTEILPGLHWPGKENFTVPFLKVSVVFAGSFYVKAPTENFVVDRKARSWWDRNDGYYPNWVHICHRYDHSDAKSMSIPGHAGSDALCEPGANWGYETPPRLSGFDLFMPHNSEITLITTMENERSLRIAFTDDKLMAQLI